MKSSAPTMKDVAQEAGVALGTVSKVINGIPVGESYRLKVEAAAAKLGYKVNQYARGLKTNRTYCVALILPNVSHPFFASLAQYVCEALDRQGYRMFLYVTASNPQAEQDCLDMVQQNKADGVICLTYNPGLTVDEELPVVSIDRYFGPSVPCVASDNFGGGRMAAEKLLELGCTHPAFFRNGPLQPGEADKRGDGFEAACRARGVDYEVMRINDEEQGLEAFRDYLQQRMEGGALDIDGIFCSTDQLALYIIRTLRELKVRVPEDVQVIGFDGIRRFYDGALFCSTIVQSAQKLAETCVDLILHKDRSNMPALVCLPVSYAPGGTTKE